jgi:hypothetical protein
MYRGILTYIQITRDRILQSAVIKIDWISCFLKYWIFSQQTCGGQFLTTLICIYSYRLVWVIMLKLIHVCIGVRACACVYCVRARHILHTQNLLVCKENWTPLSFRQKRQCSLIHHGQAAGTKLREAENSSWFENAVSNRATRKLGNEFSESGTVTMAGSLHEHGQSLDTVNCARFIWQLGCWLYSCFNVFHVHTPWIKQDKKSAWNRQ